MPNELPMTVRNTWEPISFNSKESNCHLTAWKYDRHRLAFEIPHALTDGAGLLPYFKSALFLYLSRATGKTFDPAGFRLPGEVIPESETGDPFRELDFDSVKAPLYRKRPIPDFFRLAVGMEVDKRVIYLKLPEARVMIHGQLILQAQPENSLWEIKQRKRMLPAPSSDIPQASFCVSYPKSRSFGPLDPYIENMFIITSLSKITDILCEVTCINHSFFLAFMQPFSSMKYFACFLEELSLAGIPYELLFSEPLRLSGIQQMVECKKRGE